MPHGRTDDATEHSTDDHHLNDFDGEQGGGGE
jgi:hypothetical protein